MRWWPFDRRAGEPADPVPQPADVAAPAGATVRRPNAEWRSVAPIRTVTQDDPRVLPDVGFRSSLPTTWTVPASLGPLGHDVSLAAPAGLLPSLLAPVEGYADAPELRWPSAADPVPAEWSPDWSTTSPRTPTSPVILHKMTGRVAAEPPAPAVGSAARPIAAPSTAASDPVILHELTRPAAAEQPAATPVVARPVDGDGPAAAIERAPVPPEVLDRAPEPDSPRIDDGPTTAEPDRRRRLVGDLPLVAPRTAPELSRDEPTSTSASTARSDLPPEPPAVRAVLSAPDPAPAGVEHPAARSAMDMRDAARTRTTPGTTAPSSVERITVPVELSEPAVEHPVAASPFAAAVRSEAPDIGRKSEGRDDDGAAPRREPPTTDLVERVTTRTVERVSDSPARVRPTVGARVLTHDFRLRPVDAAEPEQTRTPTTLVDGADHWAAGAQPTPDSAADQSVPAAVDLPGLPAELPWTTAEPASGADGESFVWDVRSAVRFPEREPEALAGRPSVTPPAVDIEQPVPPSAVPAALDGFSVRPPRRRRALQVGIPTPRADRAPTESVAPQPTMTSRHFVQDHEEGEGSEEPVGAPGIAADPTDVLLQQPSGPSTAMGVVSNPAHDADTMADELYDRIRGRLRQELLIDRERSLLLTDLR
jgi:hypothetical protein